MTITMIMLTMSVPCENLCGNLCWRSFVNNDGDHCWQTSFGERERRTQWFHRIQLENTIFGNFKKPKIHFAFLIWMKVTAAGEKWKKMQSFVAQIFPPFREHCAREREKVRPRGSKSKGRACLVSWLQKI